MNPTKMTREPARRRPDAASAEAGFTLLEMVVALVLSVVILLGVLALFDINNHIAKSQVNVADLQQSLRIAQNGMVRNVRMAGRGGLPVFRPAFGTDYAGMYLPTGPSIAVDDNVGSSIKLGGDDMATVVEGTDVLTVRGVLTTPLYQINSGNDGAIEGARDSGSGTLTIRRISSVGVPQDLEPLKQMIKGTEPEAILLVSSGSDEIQAVVEANGGTWSEDVAVLNFRITGGTHTDDYLKLSPNGEFPEGLKSVSSIGVLEEYRYYARKAEPAPRLSRARLYPGTNTAYRNDNQNLHVDIADNILDLQVALGIDRDGDQVVTDKGDETDDWLFNAEKDATTLANTSYWNDPARPLYYVRITTLARTDRPESDYVSPPIQAIEDHTYDEPDQPTKAELLDRSYRRRVLNTVVDLRNLT